MSTSDIRARLQAGEAIDPPTLLALLDEIERLRGETEWEYGYQLVHEGGDMQASGWSFPSAREALAWGRVRAKEENDLGNVGPLSARAVRRRKAGPWELVEEETND